MLSSEETILLNTLMYMNADSLNDNIWPLCNPQKYEGKTISDWIEKVDYRNIIDDEMYDASMTGREWKNVINAVKQDDTLMNMKIMTTHIDNAEGGGEGFSALFVDERNSEAIVAFRGTQGPDEWYDNFVGGNVVETPEQRNALEWYKDIYNTYNLESYGTVTVSGHSKGGNKSKFITIMDDTVDRCVSIDGQGFSDKFYLENSYQIAKNQDKIQNHNIDYDPVNLMLNDIGDKTYYVGQGIDGYMENHAPNSFLKFDDNGSYEMVVNQSGQSREMQEVDIFLNGFLRSLDDSGRTQTLDMIGDFVRELKRDEFVPSVPNVIDLICNSLLSDEHSADLAYLLAYTIKYEQAHLEFTGSINSVLNHFGMEDAASAFILICGLLNLDINVLGMHITFDGLYGVICNGVETIPDFILDTEFAKICLKLFPLGIKITPQRFKDLLSMLGMVKQDLKKIKLNENGKDIWVGSLPPVVLTDPFVICSNEPGWSDSAGGSYFFCNLPGMRAESDNIIGYAKVLQNHIAKLRATSSAISLSDSSNESIKSSLAVICDELSNETESLKQLGIMLRTISDMYEKTDLDIVKNVSRSC
jgi:hypothetical protein